VVVNPVSVEEEIADLYNDNAVRGVEDLAAEHRCPEIAQFSRVVAIQSDTAKSDLDAAWWSWILRAYLFRLHVI
jgi:hypothetical protein